MVIWSLSTLGSFRTSKVNSNALIIPVGKSRHLLLINSTQIIKVCIPSSSWAQVEAPSSSLLQFSSPRHPLPDTLPLSPSVIRFLSCFPAIHSFAPLTIFSLNVCLDLKGGFPHFLILSCCYCCLNPTSQAFCSINQNCFWSNKRWGGRMTIRIPKNLQEKMLVTMMRGRCRMKWHHKWWSDGWYDQQTIHEFNGQFQMQMLPSPSW